MRLLLLLTLIATCATTAFASTPCWIFLKDKAGSTFDPHAYFDPKAIERRQREGLDLHDVSDYPVSEAYLTQLHPLTDTILFAGRWLNAVAAYVPDVEAVRRLPFVLRVEVREAAAPALRPLSAGNDRSFYYQDTTLMRYQTERLQGPFFQRKGWTGKGVRIAVFDVGFANANKTPELAHLWREGRIVRTRDFVRATDSMTWKGGVHGTMVLSCIAGKHGDVPMGLAPDAEFMLARTEYNNREVLAEEIFWAQAAEWADRWGADVLNSSLGYGEQRYFYRNMNGRDALITRVANTAAHKGVLVVNAAGNEGQDDWRFIGAPADADSVLTVGAIDPYTDMKTGFSSWGPTYDRRLKPNVSAPGVVMVCGRRDVTHSEGTSFSAPLVSGFAACVKQAHPDWKRNELFDAIENSGHLYPYYDYAHGFGAPQAGFFTGDRPKAAKTFSIELHGDQIVVILDTLPETTKNLYYHIAFADETLDKFAVLLAESKIVLSLNRNTLLNGKKLRVHYEGYTETFTL